MSHIDPEDLGLLALGETVRPDQQAHLRDCPPCVAELEQLRAAVRIGRETVDVASLARPGRAVWAAVHDELGLTAAPRELPAAAPLRRPRRFRRRPAVLVGAVAGLAAVGLVVVVLVGVTRPVVLESTRLAALPGWSGAQGTATVEREVDGRRVLHLVLTTPPTGNAYRELWLLDPADSALVSLGVVEEDDADYPVPAGVDLSRFSVVDVSREPTDGDPAHSTDSIVRGELDATAGA